MKLEKYISEIKRFQANMSPISVCVYPTNRCSCKCKMCAIHLAKEKIDLDKNTLKDVILRLETMNTESIVFIGGGEPCCYKDLGNIIDYIKDKTKINVGILTNGNTNFDYKKYIKYDCVKFIRFSIDSVDEEVYKKIRGTDLAKPLENFLDVNKRYRHKTRINALIMKDNLKYYSDKLHRTLTPIGELKNFAKSNNTEINFSFAVDCKNYKNKLDKKDLELLKTFSGYNGFGIYNDNLREILKDDLTLLDKSKCILPLIYAVIDFKGDVYPCTIAANSLGLGLDSEQTILGNIYDNEFGSIWWTKSIDKRMHMYEHPEKYKVCKWCSNGGVKTCKLYVQYRNEYTKLMNEYKPTFL